MCCEGGLMLWVLCGWAGCYCDSVLRANIRCVRLCCEDGVKTG